MFDPAAPHSAHGLQATGPHWQYEQDFWQQGWRLVAGIDEAGRGAWAGPVTVAAVILPAHAQAYPFRDSKTLSTQQRKRYAAEVKTVALAYTVVHAFASEIDEKNILGATHAAALRAIAQLQPPAQALITDYLRLVSPLPQVSPARADAQSYSVAAASLLAKTERDQYMRTLDETYPAYGFAQHKGYGTAAHRRALEQHGVLSSVHRRSFAPIAQVLSRDQGVFFGAAKDMAAASEVQ